MLTHVTGKQYLLRMKPSDTFREVILLLPDYKVLVNFVPNMDEIHKQLLIKPNFHSNVLNKKLNTKPWVYVHIRTSNWLATFSFTYIHNQSHNSVESLTHHH